MKKVFKNLSAVLVLCAFLLIGCTQFADGGGSVWQDYVWILPTLTGIGSLIFGYQAYRGSKSGSTHTNKETGVVTDQPDVNVPIWKFGQFYFSVGLAIATIFIIWNVISNR